MSGAVGGAAQRGLRAPPHPAWPLLSAPPSECGLFCAVQQLWDPGCRALAGEPTPRSPSEVKRGRQVGSPRFSPGQQKPDLSGKLL